MKNMKIKSPNVSHAYNKDSLKLIKDSAKDFALQYIKPYVMDWDESQHFPKEVLVKSGEYGFMGMLVPESYGGSGLGYHEYVASIVEISKIDPSIGLSIAAHNSLFTNHILNKWVLNGTKNFITHGKSGDISVVVFRTGPVGEKNTQQHSLLKKVSEDCSQVKKKISLV